MHRQLLTFSFLGAVLVGSIMIGSLFIRSEPLGSRPYYQGVTTPFDKQP